MHRVSMNFQFFIILLCLLLNLLGCFAWVIDTILGGVPSVWRRCHLDSLGVTVNSAWELQIAPDGDRFLSAGDLQELFLLDNNKLGWVWLIDLVGTGIVICMRLGAITAVFANLLYHLLYLKRLLKIVLIWIEVLKTHRILLFSFLFLSFFGCNEIILIRLQILMLFRAADI